MRGGQVPPHLGGCSRGRWGRLSAERKDPRMRIGGQGSGLGSGRPYTSWKGEGRHCGSDSGGQRGRGRSPESRVLPMTRGLTARHGQQQVDRGGGWGERRSRKEGDGGHARQTEKGWV